MDPCGTPGQAEEDEMPSIRTGKKLCANVLNKS